MSIFGLAAITEHISHRVWKEPKIEGERPRSERRARDHVAEVFIRILQRDEPSFTFQKSVDMRFHDISYKEIQYKLFVTAARGGVRVAVFMNGKAKKPFYAWHTRGSQLGQLKKQALILKKKMNLAPVHEVMGA